MAVTPADITTNHPEFVNLHAAHPTLIQTCIDKAEEANDATVLGDLTDTAVEWYTCYLLSVSPYAQDKRIKGAIGYYGEWESIAKATARSYRFITGQT